MAQIMDIHSDEDSTVLPEAMPLDKGGKNVRIMNDEIAVESTETTLETGVFYNGEISVWKRNHGFLKYEDENGQVSSFFLHSSNVNTTDKKVLLRKGMECRFQVQRGEDGKKDSAVSIEARDGMPLSFHCKYGANDGYDREILYDGRYFNGTVKFFSRKRGYGRIVAVPEELAEVDAPAEEIGDIYFKEIDIDAVDFPVKINREDAVRFQLFNSSRGYGGMNVQCANGDQMPVFTEEDREAKREESARRRQERQEERRLKREAEKQARLEAGEDVQDEEAEGRKSKRTRKNRRRDNEEEVQEESTPARTYEDIDESQDFRGTILSFSVHRYGFVTPDNAEELSVYGKIRGRKLCFRAQEIQTQLRPALVDNEAEVVFNLVRLQKNILYARNIRSANGGDIVAEREYEPQEPKELLSSEICTGTVKFYNWRRGHGRVIIDGEDEEKLYYFHRDDLVSNDKVSGIVDGARVTCQKANDPKGDAVTNIMNENREVLEGFVIEN